MSPSWLETQHHELAARRILDAAAELFARQGVAATGMAEIATAAGCSRATLYRHYENREALRAAYVHREARRTGTLVADDVADLTDPSRRLVEAMLASLRRVRSEPALAAWFTPGDSGTASSFARSAVIEAMVAELLGDPTDQLVRRRAGWVVRVIVSFLTTPGDNEDQERSLLEDFVAPVVTPRPASSDHRQILPASG